MSAAEYFEKALDYDPYNPVLLDNLKDAEEKVRNTPSPSFTSYLSSINTSLEIISVSQFLLLIHPSPNVRMEAQKLLVEKTLKQITDASATFVLNSQLKHGKLKPMRWDTEAEKQAKEEEAQRYSQKVENLKLQAHQEAKTKGQELKETELSGEKIKITPGPALSQLIKVSETGDW